jgi:hypothetical protein
MTFQSFRRLRVPLVEDGGKLSYVPRATSILGSVNWKAAELRSLLDTSRIVRVEVERSKRAFLQPGPAVSNRGDRSGSLGSSLWPSRVRARLNRTKTGPGKNAA